MERNHGSYLLEIKEWFDELLSEFLHRYDGRNLHPQLRHALLSKGKRVRPILVGLAAESMDGSREEVANLAPTFELLHAASLVHDDIIDNEESRRDLPTVWNRWSKDDALLTGDVLIALAIDLISEFPSKLIHKTAQAAFDLASGEYMELHFQLPQTTEDQYLTMIDMKTSSLFRSAVECGSLVSGGRDDEIQALSAFASNFGYAYQIRDDLTGLHPISEKAQEKVENLRVSLPLIHAYRVSNEKTVSRLLQMKKVVGHS